MNNIIFLMIAISSPSDGVTLAADLPKKVFRDGEPIPLACKLVNKSDRDFTYGAAYFYRHHSLIVRDTRGEEPPLTEMGEEIRSLPRSRLRKFMKQIVVVVEAGKSYESLPREGGAQNDLNKLYRLSPGKYTVSVRYNKDIEFVSTPVEFEIK
jgi:hypothetical protein